MKRKIEKYYKLLNILKKCLPPKKPVIVRRVHIPDDDCFIEGECMLIKNKFFYIRINKKMNEYQSMDALIHEWAHTLSWNTEKDFHGSKWGVAYAKVYRTYLREF